MRHDVAMAQSVPAVDIDIDLRCPLWRDHAGDIETVCRRAVEGALAVAQTGPNSVEISLVLADDAFVQALNRAWRNRDAPTNVLAFPCASGPAQPAAEGMLGDIVIAYQTSLREAADEGIPLDHHLSHLVVHGVLHLLGFDHVDDGEAADMERVEAEALGRLGISDPYADR